MSLSRGSSSRGAQEAEAPRKRHAGCESQSSAHLLASEGTSAASRLPSRAIRQILCQLYPEALVPHDRAYVLSLDYRPSGATPYCDCECHAKRSHRVLSRDAARCLLSLKHVSRAWRNAVRASVCGLNVTFDRFELPGSVIAWENNLDAGSDSAPSNGTPTSCDRCSCRCNAAPVSMSRVGSIMDMLAVHPNVRQIFVSARYIPRVSDQERKAFAAFAKSPQFSGLLDMAATPCAYNMVGRRALLALLYFLACTQSDPRAPRRLSGSDTSPSRHACELECVGAEAGNSGQVRLSLQGMRLWDEALVSRALSLVGLDEPSADEVAIVAENLLESSWSASLGKRPAVSSSSGSHPMSTADGSTNANTFVVCTDGVHDCCEGEFMQRTPSALL